MFCSGSYGKARRLGLNVLPGEIVYVLAGCTVEGLEDPEQQPEPEGSENTDDQSQPTGKDGTPSGGM